MVEISRAPERIPLTTAGRRHLEAEIERTEARIVELRELITEAHDDRSADDDERAAALGMLDEHGRLEARLLELRATLESAVDATPAEADVATIGTVVHGKDEDGEEWTYTLVSPAEAAPSAGRVSVESPLGRALVGHRPGEVVTIDAPAGSWDVRIVDIAPAA